MSHQGQQWYDDHADRWAALERAGWQLSPPVEEGGRLRMRMVMADTMGKLAHTAEGADAGELIDSCEAFAESEVAARRGISA